MLEAYTHNVRGRVPTDRVTKGLALVTGSTAGIGFQTCILLCERGVDVLVPARSVEQALKTAQLINEASKGPGKARPCAVPLDLAVKVGHERPQRFAALAAAADELEEPSLVLVSVPRLWPRLVEEGALDEYAAVSESGNVWVFPSAAHDSFHTGCTTGRTNMR